MGNINFIFKCLCEFELSIESVGCNRMFISIIDAVKRKLTIISVWWAFSLRYMEVFLEAEKEQNFKEDVVHWMQIDALTFIVWHELAFIFEEFRHN